MSDTPDKIGPMHHDEDVHGAAKGIFDMLPEDPFGEGEGIEAIGPAQDAPADEEVLEPAESDTDFDSAAAEAMSDETDGEPEDEEPEEDEDEEPDMDSEDAEDEEEAEESDEDPLVTVKVDGQTMEIPLSEALAGYSRTEVWTRKMQAVAEERKQLESEAEATQTERAQYASKLADVEAFLASQMPQEPSPEDPVAWARYQSEQQKLQQVQMERQKVQQQMQEHAANQHQQFLREQEAMLLDAIPEWKDPAVKQAEARDLATYAVGVLGFSQEEVDSLADHRNVLLLRKAREYDRLQEKTAEVKTKKRSSKTLKPGAPQRSSQKAATKRKKEYRSQRDRLRKSGAVKDAAKLIEDQFLD
jgi:hypothetical protein